VINRKRVDPKNEYILLSYMIMNADVLSATFNRNKAGELKPRHFTKDFRHIFRWLMIYYSKHKKPPKKTIQEIFERHKKKLNKNTQEIVEEYLNRIAEEYIKYGEENIDPEYVRKEILPDFIRERELSDRIEKAQDRLDQGNFEDAERIISTYPSVTFEEEDENLGIIIPFTKEDVDQGMANITSRVNEAFRFEGDLDKLIGPLGKGWLVAITGIEKSGKSYLLQEIGYLASLYQKKKVLCINLELHQNLVRSRVWHRISKTTNKRDAGRIVFPILDCENNQFGTCQLKKKNKKKVLFRNNTEEIIFTKKIGWEVCHDCRSANIRMNASRTKRFVPTIWFAKKRIRDVSANRVKRALKRREMMRLSDFRVKCFPRYSVTFDEARTWIMRYMDKSKWYPDIIMFDYLDILAPEQGNLQERIDVDRKWKKGSKLAGELNCLVLNADQATKASRTQYALDQMSTSESKTKDSHLDVRIAINQTDSEKALGIIRTSVLFHRHASFNVKREVLVTQRLATGESMMDNAFLFDRGKKYRVTPENF